MPNVPVTWLNEFTANLTTGGAQFDPDIIQLSNGNILVAWSSDSNPFGANGAGYDVIGQQFSPLGVKVGNEFQVNDFAVANNENNVDLAPFSNGGYISVYQRVNITTGIIELCYEYRISSGDILYNDFISTDSTPGEPNFSAPVVAVSSDIALIMYQKDDFGGNAQFGRIFSPSNGNLSAEFILAGGGANVCTGGDVTALNNGLFAITYRNGSGNTSAIYYQIVNNLGQLVPGSFGVAADTASSNGNDFEPSITGLSNGNFVVSWTNTDAAGDRDIDFVIVNSSTGAQSARISAGVISNANINDESDVVALKDGSFVIVYRNDVASTLVAEHFSAAGVNLGSFTFAGSGVFVSAVALADGRLAVAWSSLLTGEISLEILDTRDVPNNPGVYTPNPWIVGTINGEAIVGTGANEIIGGGLGDDSIAGGFGNDTMDGGGGSDVMAGGLGDDTYITDSLGDFIGEGVNEGNDIVLSGVSYAMGANIEQVVLTGFAADGVLGNDLANAILGNNYDNGISGGQGGDVILGQYGNDIINGGEGADYMDGFIGTDTFFVDNAGDVVVEIFEGGVFDTVWTTVHFTLPDYVEIFIAQGNGNINGVGNNDVTLMLGNSGVNALAGLGGGDIILGQGGADVIDGGSGNDTISGGTESDTLIGGLGNDLFVYSTFNEGGATGDVYTDFTTGFGANGDILDLRPLFTTFAPGFGTTSASAIIAGYLTFTQGGADTYVFIDPNGGVHNPGELVFLALLQNVNANALQANTLVV